MMDFYAQSQTNIMPNGVHAGVLCGCRSCKVEVPLSKGVYLCLCMTALTRSYWFCLIVTTATSAILIVRRGAPAGRKRLVSIREGSRMHVHLSL